MERESFFESFILLLNQVLDKDWFFEINGQQTKILGQLRDFFLEMQDESLKETFEAFLRKNAPSFHTAIDYLLHTVTVMGGFFRENALMLSDYLTKLLSDYQRYYSK